MSQAKQRYCRLCGGEIDSRSKRCAKCDKQYFKFTIKTAITAIVCLVAICLLGLNVFQYTRHQEDITALEEQNRTISQNLKEKEIQIALYRKQLQEKDGEIENLEVGIEEYKKQLQEKSDKIENLEVGIDLLEYDLEIMTWQVEFYDKHVVFVSDDGTNIYHNLRCEDFDASYFWAYNVELAEARGNTPCPKCGYNSRG